MGISHWLLTNDSDLHKLLVVDYRKWCAYVKFQFCLSSTQLWSTLWTLWSFCLRVGQQLRLIQQQAVGSINTIQRWVAITETSGAGENGSRVCGLSWPNLQIFLASSGVKCGPTHCANCSCNTFCLALIPNQDLDRTPASLSSAGIGRNGFVHSCWWQNTVWCLSYIMQLLDQYSMHSGADNLNAVNVLSKSAR